MKKSRTSIRVRKIPLEDPSAQVKYQKIIEDNDVRVRPVGDYAVGGLKVDTKGLQDCRRVSQELDAYVRRGSGEHTSKGW